jgi:adenylate cyclase
VLNKKVHVAMAKGITVGDEARLDYVTLRFLDDPDAERTFLEDYYRKSINQMRIAIVLAIVITSAFGIRDAWITPTVIARLWFVRYAIICPFFLAALLCSFTGYARQFMQLCISLGMLVYGLGIVAMLVIAPAPGNNMYFAGLLLIPLFPPTIRVRFIYSSIASWTIIAAYEIAAISLTHTSLPYLINNNFFLITSTAIGMITSYMLELFARKNFIQQIQLEKERDRSERLLLNILPPSIAHRLKQKHETIADGFAEATVLFADIAGFTRLAASRSPREVVDLLNDIFSEFDHLAEKHGVEKIKTIGDAYMAVAGLPVLSPDHATAIVELALDMQAAVSRRGADGRGPISLRIGINTGPVVAGVIGMKKFIYDVWGDTVNTASRMESHGIEGGIQVTEETYARLKHAYRLEERGTLKIKGKGEMRTYMLTGRIASARDVRGLSNASD